MKLRDFMIADQSHMVLDRLGQEVVGVPLVVERKLESIGDPDLSWHMETADPGFVRAFSNRKRRDLIVIEHARLREYSVLIACRAHGTALHVAWMVLVTPRLANDLRRAARINVDHGSRFEIGAELDVFDVADLKAFIGITRLALKQAIRDLSDGDVNDNDHLFSHEGTE